MGKPWSKATEKRFLEMDALIDDVERQVSTISPQEALLLPDTLFADAMHMVNALCTASESEYRMQHPDRYARLVKFLFPQSSLPTWTPRRGVGILRRDTVPEVAV